MIRPLVAAFFVLAASAGVCQPTPGGDQEIQALVNSFFRAIAEKDLDAAASLWQRDSPYFVSAREDLRRLFAANRISLAEAKVEWLRFTRTDEARTRASTEIQAFDTLSGVPAEGYGRQQRLFDWVRENGAWKIRRYAPEEAELADALIEAKTAPERTRLLTASPDLSTAGLILYLNRQARQASQRGQSKEALRISDVTMEAANAIGDQTALGRAELSKAAILNNRSENEEARSLIARALARFSATNYLRGEAEAHGLAGTIDIETTRIAEASTQLELSLKIAKEIRDRTAEAEAERRVGEVQRLQGRLDRALASFEDSLRICRDLGDRAGQAAALANAANVWYMRAAFQKAIDTYQQVRAIDDDLGDKFAQAADWGNIGMIQDAAGKPSEASESLRESLRLHIETADRRGQAITLQNLGNLLMESGNLPQAIEKYDQSAVIARQIQDKATEALALFGLGTVYRSQGELRKAWIVLQDSLRIDQDTHDTIGEAQSRGMIADLEFDAGYFNEAQQLTDSVLPVFKQRGMKVEQAAALHNLGTLWQSMGNYDGHYAKAAASYEESLRIKKQIFDISGQTITLNNLAQLYLALGELEKSADHAREGIKLSHALGNPAAEALNTLALADNRQIAGNASESRQAYEEALRLAKSSGASNVAAGAYVGLSSFETAGSRFSEAVADCQKAVEAVDSTRADLAEPSLQIGFISLNQKPYHCLLNNQLNLGLKEAALRTVENARARTLLDMLGRGKVNIYNNLAPTDEQQLRELDRRVMDLESQRHSKQPGNLAGELKAARQARDEFARVLYLKSPDLAVKRGQARALNLADLTTLLPDHHSAILEYVLEERAAWLFVLRGPAQTGNPPDLFVHLLETNQQEIATFAHNFWERLRKQGAEGPEGAELARLLLAPAYPELAGVTYLGIVPDGKLWLTPFAALRDAEGQYLIKSKAIYYAPSLTALSVMERTAEQRQPAFEARLKARGPAVLLAGHPSLGASHSVDLPLRGAFAELPYTAMEIREIARLPGIHARVLVSGEATRERVKAELGNYPVVHFATHGFFDAANPMYSGILLSQSGASVEDGFWDAREIAEQKLDLSLVVVSACETARGQIFAGEGVLGLSWAFFVAGASANLLTDWQVNDASTGIFMREFYRRWRIGDMAQGSQPLLDKAKALQAAQNWMLSEDKYSDPFYWAPFVLIGAPR